VQGGLLGEDRHQALRVEGRKFLGSGLVSQAIEQFPGCAERPLQRDLLIE
jgi:hypothetical protein